MAGSQSRDALTIFRQQIGIARQLHTLLEQSNKRPAQLAAMQGSLLALELGFLVYGRAIYKAPSALSLTGCLKGGINSDYRAREIATLLASPDHWLAQLSNLFDSLKQLPGTANKAGSAASNNLIASSQDKGTGLHWTQLDKCALKEFLDRSYELQQRHSASDEEY